MWVIWPYWFTWLLRHVSSAAYSQISESGGRKLKSQPTALCAYLKECCLVLSLYCCMLLRFYGNIVLKTYVKIILIFTARIFHIIPFFYFWDYSNANTTNLNIWLVTDPWHMKAHRWYRSDLKWMSEWSKLWGRDVALLMSQLSRRKIHHPWGTVSILRDLPSFTMEFLQEATGGHFRWHYSNIDIWLQVLLMWKPQCLILIYQRIFLKKLLKSYIYTEIWIFVDISLHQ